MKPQDDNTGYIYNRNVPWRYSGISAKFLGLDPWVIIVIPVGIIGLRAGWGYPLFALLLGLIGMFIYVSMKGYPNVRTFVQAMGVKLFGRGRWKTR